MIVSHVVIVHATAAPKRSLPAAKPPADGGAASHRAAVACRSMAELDLAAVIDRLDAAYESRPRDASVIVGALEDAVRAARAYRDNQELPPVAELLGDLADEYVKLDRTDDALAAMREAIAAGYGGKPDPECRIAEILMSGGREAEARPIWDSMAEKYPDDVWVFNNAGLEYGALGDHETALEWLTHALEIALRTGDPERLTDQLHNLRATSLAELGRDGDELQERARRYMARLRTAPRPRPSSGEAGPGELPPALDRSARSAGQAGPTPVAFAWFPASEFDEALKRWPELAESWGEDTYGGYCAAMDRHMTPFAESGQVRVLVAPILVKDFLAWAEREGKDPATSDARSSYAAELNRLRADGVTAWPPGRNDACWCGRGRKYKKCCGAPANRTRS
jgi:tetratricopeptide (TPR) repeat protein